MSRHPRDPVVADALPLLPKLTDEVVVGTVRDLHLAWSDRFFGLVNRSTGNGALVPKVVHDQISGGVYGGLSLFLRAAGASLRLVGAGQVGPRLDASGPGKAVHAAVNGLIGDRLREEHPALAITMSVRVRGDHVPVDPANLAAAFPNAGGRLVVFVHGLGEHEDSWERNRYQIGGTYGSRLEAAAGWTPVYLRVNTGLSVRENGVALTSLLQHLVEAWPADVRRLALVGHSMGGLIIRSACAVTTGAHRPWTELLSDVVTLGTPHLGSDLARAAKRGSTLLARAPETAAFGRFLDQRSVGITDMEHGLPDLPPLPRVRYRLVSAEIGRAGGVLGRLFGDLLVRRSSATGAARRARAIFPEADHFHVPGTDHFGLLNHPDVYRVMKEWLA